MAEHAATRNRHQLFKAKFIQAALNAVGLRFEADGSLSGDGRQFNIHSVQAFLNSVAQKTDEINGLKICKLRDDFKTSLRWFLSLLGDSLGLTVNQVKIRGERYYYISLNELNRLNQYLVRRFEHFCAYLETDEGAAETVEDNIINIAVAPSFQQAVQAAQTEAEVLDLIDETWFARADDDLCALVVERLPANNLAKLKQLVCEYVLMKGQVPPVVVPC